ncbi:hypothetical protein FORMB_26060 [Formosa sp. Hel1_33_131]|nr:hypothetical protein FORMB_26060 [Formosa sp. Hel1_33_131]
MQHLTSSTNLSFMEPFQMNPLFVTMTAIMITLLGFAII